MLWGDGFFLWALTPLKWRRTRTQKLAVAGGLAAVILLVTAVYIYTRHVVFFEASYGIGAVLIVIRCAQWSQWNKRARL